MAFPALRSVFFVAAPQDWVGFLSTLSDWSRKLARLSQPISEPKRNRDLFSGRLLKQGSLCQFHYFFGFLKMKKNSSELSRLSSFHFISRRKYKEAENRGAYCQVTVNGKDNTWRSCSAKYRVRDAFIRSTETVRLQFDLRKKSLLLTRLVSDICTGWVWFIISSILRYFPPDNSSVFP